MQKWLKVEEEEEEKREEKRQTVVGQERVRLGVADRRRPSRFLIADK